MKQYKLTGWIVNGIGLKPIQVSFSDYPIGDDEMGFERVIGKGKSLMYDIQGKKAGALDGLILWGKGSNGQFTPIVSSMEVS